MRFCGALGTWLWRCRSVCSARGAAGAPVDPPGSNTGWQAEGAGAQISTLRQVRLWQVVAVLCRTKSLHASVRRFLRLGGEGPGPGCGQVGGPCVAPGRKRSELTAGLAASWVCSLSCRSKAWFALTRHCSRTRDRGQGLRVRHADNVCLGVSTVLWQQHCKGLALATGMNTEVPAHTHSDNERTQPFATLARLRPPSVLQHPTPVSG